MTSMEFDLKSPPGAVSPNPALITVFNTLQMAGLVLLLVVFLTARLAPTVKRSPAWYNIIIAWIISSSSSLLLMGQQTGRMPPFGLCLLQSMLIYAAPAMNACACLCFALELFFGVFGAATQTQTPSGCKVFPQSKMNALSMTARELESESAQGAGSPNPALITAFNVVQMTGLVLLLAVILTAWLAPSVKRSIAWFNVIISWIFSASSFLLLMGRQTGPEPPFGLCLFQSMLIYAAPAMNACVCVSFALELFFNVSAAAAQTPASRNWKLFVEKRTDLPPSPTIAVTIFMFIRNWGTLRNLCAEQNGGLPLRLVIRYGVFCLLPVPIVTISLVSWQFQDASPNAANVAVAIATLPIMTALIFGTQWDIFRVWMFWRRSTRAISRKPQVKPQPLPPAIPFPLPQEEIELDTKPKYCEA
ncbi:hypothetical protein CCMSSC00406_0001889 [Pleurotus cornucopiae]|uniref:Uncharacterized protein n=1 Tax=Pleurotus cornucopiae TaxID=5321 RepID=A0ACB7J3Z6_PLECO|nr:hypothetical protein CCMSSC00406_0001889 [Pleurotus cornucopiae]